MASHFTGSITNDFASEFDPFSPQFGEKFAVPNLPVAVKDFSGREISRVYGDQWGIYNGMTSSTWTVFPPSPSGYIPNMMIMCMNDPGPIPDPANPGLMITDPYFNPAYSNFCYEIPYMPGQTSYLDTPVVPTMAFAAGYNLPDCEYPDTTPAIRMVNGDGIGPWVGGTSGNVVSAVNVTNGGSNYASAPNVTFSGGGGSGATAIAVLKPSAVVGVTRTATGAGYTSIPTVVFGGTGTGATATANMGVGSVTITNSGQTSYQSATPTVTATFSPPNCPTINGTTCVLATGTVNMTTSGNGGGGANNRRRVASITITNPGAGYTAPPTVSFSRGNAAATTTLGVGYVALLSGGSGYVGAPPVTFSGGGGGSGAAATASVSAAVASVMVTNGGSGYASAPTVSFSGGGGLDAAAMAVVSPTGTLTIYALGDKQVLNHAYSGPNATAAPFNNKLITRHYGFGSQSSGTQCTTGQSCVALVGSDGVLRAADERDLGRYPDHRRRAGEPAQLHDSTA